MSTTMRSGLWWAVLAVVLLVMPGSTAQQSGLDIMTPGWPGSGYRMTLTDEGLRVQSSNGYLVFRGNEVWCDSIPSGQDPCKFRVNDGGAFGWDQVRGDGSRLSLVEFVGGSAEDDGSANPGGQVLLNVMRKFGTGDDVDMRRTWVAHSSYVSDGLPQLHHWPDLGVFAEGPIGTPPPPAGPAPSIAGVSPASPTANPDQQSVTVSGANFVAPLGIQLIRPDGVAVSPGASSVTSSSFAFGPVLATTGTYVLRATNPDGQQSNGFSFAVQAAPQPPSGNPIGIPFALVSKTNLTGTLAGLQTVGDSAWLTADNPNGDVSVEVDLELDGAQTQVSVEVRRTSSGSNQPYVYIYSNGAVINNGYRPESYEVIPSSITGTGVKRIRVAVSGQDGTVEIGGIRAQ